eukprot:6210649-Heterocapsa_arctica.AAC.1
METAFTLVWGEVGNSPETVRHIIHDNADRLWSAHMKHDVDKSELAHFKERTMDRTECGAFEHIILW